MKIMIRKLVSLIVLGGCIWTAGSSHAQQEPQVAPNPTPPDRFFYIQGDIGGQWTHDITLNEFFGVPLTPDSKIKLDPGLRAGVSGGYQFCGFFALEGELGFMGNRINSITSATFIHDAYVANMPLLVNAKFMLPNRTIVTPFAGAGVGFSQTIIDVDHITILDTAGGVTSMHGSDWDTVFAWHDAQILPIGQHPGVLVYDKTSRTISNVLADKHVLRVGRGLPYPGESQNIDGIVERVG